MSNFLNPTPTFEYVSISKNSKLVPKGTKLALEGGVYFDQDETIYIKSSNYTGSIIKKLAKTT